MGDGARRFKEKEQRPEDGPTGVPRSHAPAGGHRPEDGLSGDGEGLGEAENVSPPSAPVSQAE